MPEYWYTILLEDGSLHKIYDQFYNYDGESYPNEKLNEKLVFDEEVGEGEKPEPVYDEYGTLVEVGDIKDIVVDEDVIIYLNKYGKLCEMKYTDMP